MKGKFHPRRLRVVNMPFFFCIDQTQTTPWALRLMVASIKRVFQTIPPDVENVGKAVLDASFRVHTASGLGLLESVYRIAAKHVLETYGNLAETEVKLPIVFEGIKLESGLRCNLVAGDCVIAGLETVEK